MNKLHVHFGSWKSASTLIQMTLRKNADKLAAQGVVFADQYSPAHAEQFAPKFRTAIEALENHGPTAPETEKLCAEAAELFTQFGSGDGVNQVLHSWENFVGHPFARNGRTLYHGAVSAYWFDRYLSHLAPRFTFIIRNQADLIEAMYTQEVRKGRFLDTIDAFLDRFVKGRDLSWLPVVEPFIARFGAENVRVIPFESITRDSSEAFLDRFFDPILDFPLEKSVSHSNPSFSAKAVEMALKTYPGLSPAEIRKEEARLVREYSNLKYPRSDFLGTDRRAAILSGVAQDNATLFKQYVSPEDAGLAAAYQPTSPVSGTAAKTWLDRIRGKIPTDQAQKLWLIDVNGHRKSIPLQQVDAAHQDLLPKELKGRTVLLSRWNFNIPMPKGEPLRCRFRANRSGKMIPGLRLDLIELGPEGIERQATMETRDRTRPEIIARSEAFNRFAAVISHDGSVNLKHLRIAFDMSEAQKLPALLELTPEGVTPGGLKGPFASHPHKLAALPRRVNAMSALAPGEVQADPQRPAPTGPRPFFLTIDTESFYFKRPVMMTGEGLEGAQASYEILDALDRRKLKGVFYVNVYEHLQYGDDSVERLCKDIHERGHEVALHCHKSASLDFYDKEIINYDYDGQRRILEYGKLLIQSWLGTDVINFRAGGYAHNGDTLRALEDLGFRIDSSYFYKHSSAPAHDGHFIQPYRAGKLIEVPVLYLPLVLQTGLVSDRKFDVNSINLPELLSTLKHGSPHLPVFSYMMHSFSFIARERFTKDQPGDKLLMRSPPLNSQGLYMGVTGLREALWRDFMNFLDALAADENIRVCTMESAVEELEEIVDQGPWPEIVPVLYR